MNPFTQTPPGNLQKPGLKNNAEGLSGVLDTRTDNSPVASGNPARLCDLELPEFWPPRLAVDDPEAIAAWVIEGCGWKKAQLWLENQQGPAIRRQVYKRPFDLLLLAASLPIVLPLLAGISLALRVASPRQSIFVKEERLGRGCKPLKLLSFRHAGISDSVSPVERFLSRAFLYKLPQLWHVLLGDMSLVGPCPLQPSRIRQSVSVAPDRFRLRPGFFGVAQLDCEISVALAGRLQAEQNYSESGNFVRDLGVLFMAPVAYTRFFILGRSSQSFLLEAIEGFGRRPKQFFLLCVDVVLSLVAMTLAYSLRLNAPPASLTPALLMSLAVLAVRLPLFVRLGMYRLKLSSRVQTFSHGIFVGTLFSSVAVLLPLLAFPIEGVPRFAFLIEAPFAAMLILGSRELMSAMIHSRRGRNRLKKPVLIYGAGNVGTQLALSIQADDVHSFSPVAFLDDDASKQGLRMCGLEVLSPARVERYIKKHKVNTVLFAMPSVKGWEKSPLIQHMQELGLSVQSVPSLIDIISGKKSVDEMSVISSADLLGRDAVEGIPDLLAYDVKGRVVCVTGAGGSIGSELCRQVALNQPEALVLFEQSEFNLYEIEMELGKAFPNLKIAAILGSVCDQRRISSVLGNYRVDTLYHAAAYKHVPMVEQNPLEGVRNNVLGTLTAAEAALAAGVSKFVLISTDKAVRPTNVMGATKRAAEEACAYVSAKAAEQDGGTIFGMVRFGNVLDSAGSVVPLFRKQIARGENLTVTDKDVTRYFMTIREAAQLVMQAGAQATCGEVFLLDMGDPIKVHDLAKRMIQLHTTGNGSSSIGIEITGLRPGEKLFEELFLDKEKAEATRHLKIWKGVEGDPSNQGSFGYISQLREALSSGDSVGLLEILHSKIEGYSPETQASELSSNGDYRRSFSPKSAKG